jgi:hypothetical protein
MRALLLVLCGVAACGGATKGCPATMPPLLTATGSECTTGGQACTYGDTVCDCLGGDGLLWYCRSTSCPAPGQANGSCSDEGLICTYGFEDSCDCSSGEWACVGGTPTDGG